MNQLSYRMALTRRDELLRQAASYRLATDTAADTEARRGVAAYVARRRSRPTIRGRGEARLVDAGIPVAPAAEVQGERA
jgi:hypothetical protein